MDVDGQPIHVDPELLFQRLIVASNVIDDRKALFRFELCSYPSALFDDTVIPRSPQKAVLANAIWTRLPPDIGGPTGEVQHVLDGRALLHRITWPHWFPTHQDICALYCDYMSRNFGPAIVVFDGYRVTSTKYTTHQRRTGGKVGIEVTYTGDLKLTISKDVFLADDTDLVILLCYYAYPDGFDLFMQCSTRGTTKKNRICDIKVTQCEMGADTCNNIMFIHAILGYDTTSRLYGLGKGLSLKRFTSSVLFRDKAEQFGKKDATVDDVIDAGEAALVCLYSGKEGDNLDGLRYAKCCDKVATN